MIVQLRHIPQPLETLWQDSFPICHDLYTGMLIIVTMQRAGNNEDAPNAPPRPRDIFCSGWDHLMKIALFECGADFHSTVTQKPWLPTILSFNVLWLLFFSFFSSKWQWWVNRNWVCSFQIGSLLNVSCFSRNHQKLLAFIHNSTIIWIFYKKRN